MDSGDVPSLDSVVEAMLPLLTEWRRDVHQHPEPGFEEVRTAAKVLDTLGHVGQVTRCATTGIWIDIKGKGPANVDAPVETIALRADMDALTMTESNPDLPYRSQNEGLAHMCGHDGHMTMLCGAALAIHQAVDRLPSNTTVRLLFQPAEEGPGGAVPMIKDGCLVGVDEVYGMHNWPGTEPGTLRTRAGPFMAHVMRFVITVTGKGGHASQPHAARDPVLAAAHIILAAQSIVSRNIAYSDSAVVSICKINGGERYNVIPEQVVLEGTSRDLCPDVAALIRKRLVEVCQTTAQAYGSTAEVDWKEDFDPYPVLSNCEEQAGHVVHVAQQLLGEANVDTTSPPSLAAEDFAFFLNTAPPCLPRSTEPTPRCPGAFFFMGSKRPGHDASLHSNHFDFNDKATPHGVKMWVRLVEHRLGARLYA